MTPPAAVTYEVPYLAALRVATEGVRTVVRDFWIRFMAPILLAAAILLLVAAIVLTSPRA